MSTAAVQLAWPAIVGVQRAGLEVAALLEPLGLTRDEVRDPVRRLPYALLCQIWDRAAEITHDPAFGISVVGAAPAGSLSVFEHVLHNTGPLQEKISYYRRFASLYQDASEIEIAIDGDQVVFGYQQAPGTPRSAPLTEFALACCVGFPRELGRRPEVKPREVRFAHEQPQDIRPHEKFFGCPVKFGAERSVIVFPAEDFTGDERGDVGAFAGRRCSSLRLTTLPAGSAQVARVGELVMDLIIEGRGPTLDLVSRRLFSSSRTLRRRLAHAGTSFQQVVDGQRCELALRLLEDPAIRTTDVATRLSFRDPKSFTRAFRRWTGMSPREYRGRSSSIGTL